MEISLINFLLSIVASIIAGIILGCFGHSKYQKIKNKNKLNNVDNKKGIINFGNIYVNTPSDISRTAESQTEENLVNKI